MRLRTISIFCSLAAALALAACADPTGKGAEDGVPADLDKADSQRTPTDLGAVTPGQTVTATLAASARYLAWELDLSGDATISLDTSRAPHAASIDTVLYVYKQGATGWGRYLARNDDAGSSPFSSIDLDVGAGHYRALVKGYTTTTYGAFDLTYGCTGPGCAAAPACAFGATFGGLDPAAFAIDGPHHLTAASVLSTLEQAQVVRAMHASSHTDVTTAAQAFAAADQGVIDEYTITDAAAVRRFTAFEYGAGDNPYGAIFARGSTDVAAEIHDGDLASCTVVPATCVFGHAAGDYATNPALAIGTRATYSATTSVPVALQGEIVAAVRAQRPQVAGIEDVWAQVDGGKVKRVDVADADGRAFTIVTFAIAGATDGAAFDKGTTTRVVSIVGGATQDCAAF